MLISMVGLRECRRRFVGTGIALASLWRSSRPPFAVVACSPRLGSTPQGDPTQQIMRDHHPEDDASDLLQATHHELVERVSTAGLSIHAFEVAARSL